MAWPGLEPGSILALCTDGILERRNPEGEFFGEDGLKGVVRSRAEASATAILESLYEAAWRFGNGRPWEDDATAVIVKRL